VGLRPHILYMTAKFLNKILKTVIIKLYNNRIDCPQLLRLFCFHVPRRIPRALITPLCPPLRRTVLGANSPVPRLCKCVNSLIDVVDLHSSLVSFRKVNIDYNIYL
jgi:hypothetical protein